MLDGAFRLIPMQESDLDEVLVLEQRSFSEPWTRKMFLGELHGNAFATNLVLRAGGVVMQQMQQIRTGRRARRIEFHHPPACGNRAAIPALRLWQS